MDSIIFYDIQAPFKIILSSMLLLNNYIALIILSCLPTPSTAYTIPQSNLFSTRLPLRGHHSRFSAANTNNESTHSDTTFDETAYETDRLAKDAIAMDEMKKVADEEYAKLRTPWKWRIRRAVWDFMEANDIAQFPRYVLIARENQTEYEI